MDVIEEDRKIQPGIFRGAGWEADNLRGGEMEGVPNNRCGGSCPVTPIAKSDIRGGVFRSLDRTWPSFGPNGLRIYDCGGRGDCGWRALAVCLLVQRRKSLDVVARMVRFDEFVTDCRVLALRNLLLHDDSWESNWIPDPEANPITEGGPPAEDIAQFRTVLMRPKRWICEVGFQGFANAHQCIISVFSWSSGWRELRRFRPLDGDIWYEINVGLIDQHYVQLLPFDRLASSSAGSGLSDNGSWISVGDFNNASLRGGGILMWIVLPPPRANLWPLGGMSLLTFSVFAHPTIHQSPLPEGGLNIHVASKLHFGF